MATVLVVQATPALEELVSATVRLGGHEPLRHDAPGALDGRDVDLLVLDPALPGAVGLARSLRDAKPKLPLVLLSPRIPPAEAVALRPMSFLLMPFAIAELERAISAALTSSASATRDPGDIAGTPGRRLPRAQAASDESLRARPLRPGSARGDRPQRPAG